MRLPAALLAFLGFCFGILAPAHAAIPTRTLAFGEILDWSFAGYRGPPRIQAGPVLLHIQGRRSADSPDLVHPVLTVEMEAYAPITLAGNDTSPTMEHRIIVGRWDAERPYVLFQSFSGGAHCCNLVQIVYPENGRLQKGELGEWDGDYLDDLPTDLDGDGKLDFVFRDNAFLYAFESYAGSLAPPQVFNVEQGERVDVSARPAFGRLFEEEMNADRGGCVEEHSNGACAAYVASAARIGQFDRAWSDMLQAYDRHADWEWPTGCRIAPVDRLCPDGQEIRYGNYPDALRAFLVREGYISS